MSVKTENKGLIKSVRLNNFSLYEDEKINLPTGITILSGKNGSGKSLFLDALRLVFGLKSRTIRMEKIADYIRDKKKNATIEVVLRNPESKLIIGNNSSDRILNIIDNPEFNIKYLRHDSVSIRRIIQPKGKSFFQIYNHTTKKFEQISPQDKKSLLEVYLNIGIDVNDELVFVPAEDFLSLINESPEKRYNIFVKKLGMENSIKKYKDIINNLKEKVQSKKELEININKKNVDLSEAKRRYDLWLEKQEKIKKIQEYEKMKKISEILELQKSINRYKNEKQKTEEEIRELINDKTEIENELEQLKEQFNESNNNYLKKSKEYEKAQESFNILKGSDSQLSKEKKKILKKLSESNAKKQLLIEKIRINEQKIKKFRENSEKKDTLKEYNKQISKFKKEKKELEIKIDELENQISNKREEIYQIYNKKERVIQEKINSLKEQSSAQSEKNYNNKNKKKLDRMAILANEFKREIARLKLSNKVIGPLYQVIDINPYYEKWRVAASYALSNILFDFITFDKNIFVQLDKLRDNPKFQGINLGYIDKNNLPKRVFITDGRINSIKKEAPCDVNFVYKILSGEQLAIHYARIHSGADNVLVDSNNSKLLLNLSLKYPFKFNSLEGRLYSSKEGSTRSPGKLREIKTLIGTKQDDEYENQFSGKEIYQKIKKLENELYAINKERMNSLKKDPTIIKLRKERDQIVKRIGEIDNSIKRLNNERDKKDPNILLENLKKENDKLKEDLKILDSKIKEYEEEIADKDEKILDNERKLEKWQEKYKELQNIVNKLGKENKKKEKLVENKEIELKSIIDRINKVIKQNKKFEENIDNYTEKMMELKEEYGVSDEQLKVKDVLSRAVLDDRINNLEKEIKKINVSERDKKLYEELTKFLKEANAKMDEYKKAINLLEKEGEEWKTKINQTIETKIKHISKLFSEILNSIDADGKIDVQVVPNEPNKLTIYTKFKGENFRPIDQHSSGQKQAGIIALVLALQSQSVSPITAIDEFDRGLDPINKRELLNKIPSMIEKALTLKSDDLSQVFKPQFILVAPDISPKYISGDINFMSCIKVNVKQSKLEINSN